MKEEFGALFKRLYGDLRKPQFDFLREAFAQYLTDRLRVQYYGDRSSSASDDEEYISVTEARRLLKISHDSLLELLKTGEIAFAIRNQDGTLSYLLRLADVESVKMKYEQAIGSRELAKQLGVDHMVISRLVQEGHLRRKSRRTIDGYHASKFDPDATITLLARYDITSTNSNGEKMKTMLATVKIILPT